MILRFLFFENLVKEHLKKQLCSLENMTDFDLACDSKRLSEIDLDCEISGDFFERRNQVAGCHLVIQFYHRWHYCKKKTE